MQQMLDGMSSVNQGHVYTKRFGILEIIYTFLTIVRRDIEIKYELC